uniref:Uncharacterized protein n=1 Tax=Arundo donax TaxID=35708 RepID=A0A0A9HRT8_ARUDO
MQALSAKYTESESRVPSLPLPERQGRIRPTRSRPRP